MAGHGELTGERKERRRRGRGLVVGEGALGGDAMERREGHHGVCIKKSRS
jgi:hypothetical protein